MEMKICTLYPGRLDTYSDSGNLLCLRYRLAQRGIGCSVTAVEAVESTDFSQFDLVFIGSGREPDESLVADFISTKADSLRSAVENGLCVLAIAGGMELLGESYTYPDGKVLSMAGILDLRTVAEAQPIVGNCSFLCGDTGAETVAFENHLGRMYPGDSCRPLGTVVHGKGNNGSDGTEGIRYKNIFGSYGHGPLLPRNPELCDLLIRTALERRCGSMELSALDDSAENAARDHMLSRLKV